jgi:Domain of unknown function (DUF5667)
VGNTKEFDNIFNGCLEHLLTGQETIEQCLQRCPEYAKELEPLLRTVVLMHQVADVKPSDEFRARARYQMQLKMAQAGSPAKRTTRVVPRWAVAACTAMLVFVLGGGAVLASQNVMPGNLLYAVKLTTENLQVRLAGSSDSKTEQYIAMANARISEMAWMVNNNKTQNLQAAAQRLNNYYSSIGELAMTGEAKTTFSASAIPAGPTATPSATTMVATTQTQTIAALTTEPVTTVINTTPIIITNPPVVLGTVNSNNIAAAGSNSSTNNSNRASQLLNTLNSNAAIQPSELQQLLNSDKVPENVKTVLRKALAQSNIVYQSAIDNANHQ